MNKYRNSFILSILSLLLTVIWFHSGLIKGGGEEGIPYFNPLRTYELTKTMWWDYNGGFPTLAWLPHIPLFLVLAFFYQTFHTSNYFLQGVTMFIILATGGISMNLIIKDLLTDNKNSNVIGLISGIFYILNPFCMSQIWGRGLTSQYATFALLPLGLIIFLRGLTKKNLLYAFVLSVVSVVFASAYGITTFAIVFWVVLLIGWVFWFIQTKPMTKKMLLFGFSYFVLTLFTWIIVNAFWLLPTIIDSNKIYIQQVTGATENIDTLFGVSQSFPFPVIVRLLQVYYFFSPGLFGSVYSSIFFQLISWIAPIFLFIGLFASIIKKTYRPLILFVMIFCIGLFVSLGSNPPLGWLFVKIFTHVTFLQAFRNPYEKFGIVYALGYAPLFALGIVVLSMQVTIGERIKKFGIVILLLLVSGFYLFPMWDGKLMTGPILDVPQNYIQFNNWLDVRKVSGRIGLTPFWSGDGSFYQWNKTRYQGLDPTMYLFNIPAISSNNAFPYYFDLMQAIRRSIDSQDVSGALSLLRVQYLVNREDAVETSTSEKNQIQLLTQAIYPPSIGDAGLDVCDNKKTEKRSAEIVCELSGKQGDWRKMRYLKITMKTDVAANLDLAIQDTKGHRPRWYGMNSTDYTVPANDWTTLIIPLGAPTEVHNETNLGEIKIIEVQAHPLGHFLDSVGSLSVKNIVLDPGQKEEIKDFQPVARFHSLDVYESTQNTIPPAFGSIHSVKIVPNLNSLITEATLQKQSLDSIGFLLPSQNNGKDLSVFKKSDNLQTGKTQELSNERYWIESKKPGSGFLILSENFNPEWKVISGVKKDELQDSLFNNLRLLRDNIIDENNHYVVNGYANLWKISGKTSSYAIVFMPQIYADIGRDISFVSIVFLVSGIGIYFAIMLLLQKQKKYDTK